MKTDQLLSTLHPPRSAFLRLGLIASLCLGVSAPTFAGKGGGGKPGGEDPPPDPEPDPAPVSYVLTWLPGGSDSSRLYDIDSGGVAVGGYSPANAWEERFGIVSFPDRPEMIDLEALASSHSNYPAGWRLRAAYTISDGLIISGDIDDTLGHRHCFALQLIDLGPATPLAIQWMEIFSAADVGAMPAAGATVQDASEQGDLCIQVEVNNGDGTHSFLGYVWRPADGEPSPATLAGPLEAFGSINNNRDVLWGGGIPSIENADTGATTDLGLFNGELTRGIDISESGMVVGRGKGPKSKGRTVDIAVRHVGIGWEPLIPDLQNSEATHVNSSDQILGRVGSRLFLFSDTPELGFRQIDDLLDRNLTPPSDLALWEAAGLGFAWEPALSDADGSGYGHICANAIIDGLYRAFILTPIAAP